MISKSRELGITSSFLCVAALFFSWGFVSSNNDPLIAALRVTFGLTYSNALLIQQVSFLANGLVSLPAASLGNRLGAVHAIVIALGVMIVGCVLMQFSIGLESFHAILFAMFILAVGITGLQVAANPLAAALGPQSSSHFRLSFAQTFNSLGVVLGVHFGASIMLSDRVFSESRSLIGDGRAKVEALAAISNTFWAMTVILIALALLFWTQRGRISAASAMTRSENASVLEALQSGWALFGALAIGLYVGAEVSIGSVMISFLNRSDVLGLDFEEGGRYLANFYWGGALVGRIVGSMLLTRVSAPRLLLLCSLTAVALCSFVVAGEGALIGYAALGVGLFNSVMFPTIFTITLERSGVSESSTSGLLSFAILAGVLLPMGVGRVADQSGLQLAFILPALAYGFITIFAARAGCANARRTAQE